MKEKYIRIIAAIITIAMGVIIAVCGAGTALDMYFGIGFLVTGAVLIVLDVISLTKNKIISFGQVFLAAAFTTLGVALLFTKYVSFAMLINLIVLLVLGMGIALLIFGLLTLLLAKQVPFGIIQMVIGLVIVTLVIVYLNVAEFRTVFWIIAGILIAAYGVLDLITVLTNKKLK